MVPLAARSRALPRKRCYLVVWEIVIVLVSLLLAVIVVRFPTGALASPGRSTVHVFLPVLRGIKWVFCGIFSSFAYVPKRVSVWFRFCAALARSIPVIGDLLEIAWWIISSPFRFIGWLFTSREGLPDCECACCGACKQLERELPKLRARLSRAESRSKDKD
jgi:hypothetical protein